MSETDINEPLRDPALSDMGAAALSLLDEPKEAPDAEEPVEQVERQAEEQAEGAEGSEAEASPEAGNEQEAGQESEDQEQVVETLEEFLEATEVDPEFFNDVKIKVRVNDVTSEVPFKDIVAGYQMNDSAQKYLEDAKAERAKAKEIREQETNAASTQLGVAAKLMEWVGREIEGQANTEELERLRTEDPAEYSAMKEEIRDRKERFEQAKTEAFNELQSVASQHAETSVQDFNQMNVGRFTNFVEADPDVKALGEDKAKEEYQKIGEYLVASGFPQEDVLVASDHRHFLVARKAMLYDQMKANNNVSKKRVAKVPKVLKPGTRAGDAKPETKDTAELLYG